MQEQIKKNSEHIDKIVVVCDRLNEAVGVLNEMFLILQKQIDTLDAKFYKTFN